MFICFLMIHISLWRSGRDVLFRIAIISACQFYFYWNISVQERTAVNCIIVHWPKCDRNCFGVPSKSNGLENLSFVLELVAVKCWWRSHVTHHACKHNRQYQGKQNWSTPCMCSDKTIRYAWQVDNIICLIMVKMISIKTKCVCFFSFYGLENLSSLCKEPLPSGSELLKATATPSCLRNELSNRWRGIIACRQFSTEVIYSKMTCLFIFASKKSSVWKKSKYYQLQQLCVCVFPLFGCWHLYQPKCLSPSSLFTTESGVYTVIIPLWFGSTDILKDGVNVDLDVEGQGRRTLHETPLPKQSNDHRECVKQHRHHILQTIWLPFSPPLTACYLSLEFALITRGVWHMTCWLECSETTPKNMQVIFQQAVWGRAACGSGSQSSLLGQQR